MALDRYFLGKGISNEDGVHDAKHGLPVNGLLKIKFGQPFFVKPGISFRGLSDLVDNVELDALRKFCA
jgi:hypothetical protein